MSASITAAPARSSFGRIPSAFAALALVVVLGLVLGVLFDVVTVASGVPTWEAHGFPVEYGPEAGSLDWPAAAATGDEAHAH